MKRNYAYSFFKASMATLSFPNLGFVQIFNINKCEDLRICKSCDVSLNLYLIYVHVHTNGQWQCYQG